MKLYEVNFQPDGIKIRVAAGSSVMWAAQKAGIILNSVCGGAGTCEKCMVEVDGIDEQVRACQTKVGRDMVVTIPASSRFFEQKILQEGINLRAKVDPLICKHFLELTPASIDDLRSDSKRLTDAVDFGQDSRLHTCRGHNGDSGSSSIAWRLLRRLPALFREHDYAVTAVCHGGVIFTLEPGDTTKTMFGLAVDVGTTTVVASLLNLANGKTVAVASQTNPQVTFGDDVISRIEYSRSTPAGLDNLHHRIIDCVNHLIAEVCEKSLANPWQIYEMTAAGNSTMQHLFLFVPVEQIAQSPYVSGFCSAVNVRASALGLDIHPDGNVYIMPSVAGHVGGDSVAVALATAMGHSEKMNLALDIGTNGEVILGNRERLVVCSTAAGPAFEGARVKHGMRGAAGAIEQVRINGNVEISVIGGVGPVGICGSGLIDAIAELLKVGVIDYSGRLLCGDDIGDGVPVKVRQRIVEVDNAPAFVLADAEQSSRGEAIVLTQRDIREAQLGKAAISAGIATLMKELVIEVGDIDRLYLAGAFGNYIRPESVVRVGLLPDVELDKILFVGNAASAGARAVLLSREGRAQGEQLAEKLEYVELAGRADFQHIFSECMFFPER